MEKLADDCVYPGVIEIALFGHFSEINALLCFKQKFKTATKLAGKQFLDKTD